MKNSSLFKDTYREIGKSFSRFLAILLIICLGVGFFVGVKATAPSMRKTAEDYFETTSLFDIKILSTVGFDDDDVEAFRKIDGVDKVMPSWSTDCIYVSDSSDCVVHVEALPSAVSDEYGYDELNKIDLIKGRLPENENECVICSGTPLGDQHFEIGESLNFTEMAGSSETLDAINSLTYEIVGIISSSKYISYSFGSSTIGSGTIGAYAYILPSCFQYERYTELNATITGAKGTVSPFSDEYKEIIDEIKTEAEDLGVDRFDIFIKKIEQQLEDAENEYDTQKSDADQQLLDAKKELDEAKSQLDEAKIELDDAKKQLDENEEKLKNAPAQIEAAEAEIAAGWKKYNSGSSTANAEIEKAKAQIAAAEKEIADGEAQLNAAKKEYDNGYYLAQDELTAARKKLDDGWAEFNENYKKYEDGVAQYEAGLEEYQLGLSEYKEGERQLKEAEQQLKESKAELEELSEALDAIAPLAEVNPDMAAVMQQYQAMISESEKQIAAGEQEIAYNKQRLADAKVELDAAKEQLDAAAVEIENGRVELEKAQAQLDAGESEYAAAVKDVDKQLADGKAQIEAAQKQIDEGKAQLAQGKAQLQAQLADANGQLSSGKQQLLDAEDQLAKAKAEYETGKKQFEEGKKQYEDGLKEYEDGLKKYEEGYEEYTTALVDAKAAMNDAAGQIQAGRDQIESIVVGKWYVFGRDDAVENYTGFNDDADRLNAIASIFPVFFLLVAALVCLTTMSRMVDEQRTSIGTYKALGYSNTTIAGKYMTYSVTACIIGCIIGQVLGVLFLPTTIFGAYSSLYYIPKLKIVVPWGMSVVSIIVALACTVLVAYITCRRELVEQPAQLMRPKSPKVGKKIFLERMPKLWKSFSFSSKITARNLLRYKVRFLMTVIGIAGCMALIVAALGLQDGIMPIVEKQFDEIALYDLMLGTDKSYTEEQRAEIRNELDSDSRIAGYNISYTSYIDVTNDPEGKTYNVCFIVSDNIADFETNYLLRDAFTGEKLSIENDGFVVSQKVLNLLGLSVGDDLYIKIGDFDFVPLTITGICENYCEHFAYMSSDLYTKTFEKEYKPNVISCNMTDPESDIDDFIEEWLAKDYDILSAVNIAETMKAFDDTVNSLNVIVIIMLLSAGALAFIVVYNLTNINISERVREIATLKVLGFKHRETNMYIFRENLIMGIVGIVCGAVIGYFLATFMVQTVETDVVMFYHHIDISSFVFAALLTLVYIVIVNFAMSGRLRKISMVESLKAVE